MPSAKIQTCLKGVPLEKFRHYMEKLGLSQYQAAADLIVRGLFAFEREKAVKDSDSNLNVKQAQNPVHRR